MEYCLAFFDAVERQDVETVETMLETHSIDLNRFVFIKY